MSSKLMAGGVAADALATSPVTVTFSATPTFDCNAGNFFQITLTGNVTSSTITNQPTDASRIRLRLVQDATGSRTVVFPTTFRFAGGTNGSSTSPTLTTTASKADEFVLRYDPVGALWIEESRDLNLPTS